ncbi:reverse transcriptase domain-containing protein [Tanacetum coccineum]
MNYVAGMSAATGRGDISRRQYTRCRSNAEAEYYSIANAIAETSWLRNLLRELHYPLHSATIIIWLLDNSRLGLAIYDISLIDEDFLSQIPWHYDGIDEAEILKQPFKCRRPKRKNVARACTAGSEEKKAYAGNLPYCNKCKLHHIGPCTVKCGNCKRVGHMTRDCRTSIPATTQGAPVTNKKTKTVEIKLGMEKLGKEHMRWEEEKSTKTRTSLRALMQFRSAFSLWDIGPVLFYIHGMWRSFINFNLAGGGRFATTLHRCVANDGGNASPLPPWLGLTSTGEGVVVD